jgi:tetratricopeptide (TPR) repeat protein
VTRRSTIAVAVLALATGTAHAGEPGRPDVIPQKARALADRGRAFHDAGDYPNAIIAFKEAYVMAPSPGLLFNLAQAYRLQGNCDDAALMYRRYINTGPSSEARGIAEAHLGSVERCVQKRALNIPVDESVGPAPTPGAPDGSLFVSDSKAATRAELQKDIGIGLAIGGGIAMAAAIYYAFDAHSAATSIEDAYAHGAKWKDVAPIDQRGERSARLAKICGVGGGIAIAGGVALYVIGKRTERLAPIALVPTKHGAEVSVAWRF